MTGGLTYRFTDFLVNEISLSGEVLHLRDIGIPPDVEQLEEGTSQTSAPDVESKPSASATGDAVAPQEGGDESQPVIDDTAASLPAELQFEEHVDWQAATTTGLRKHFSDETILALRRLFDEGRTPPPRQDSGWGSREKRRSEQVNEEEQAMNVGTDARPSQGRGRGAGRGGRAAPNSNPFKANDSREVVTQVRGRSRVG